MFQLGSVICLLTKLRSIMKCMGGVEVRSMSPVTSSLEVGLKNWSHCVPPKRCYLHTSSHASGTQKTNTDIFMAVRPSSAILGAIFGLLVNEKVRNSASGSLLSVLNM